MLTFPTPTDVLPFNPATKGRRTHGAVGIIADGAMLADWVRVYLSETYPDYYPEPESVRVAVEDMLILTSPIGEVVAIGHEGVGDVVDLDSPTIPVYFAVGFQWSRFDVPAAIVQECLTTKAADVADFVRVFGDRLDGNAYTWRRFCGV